MLSLWKSLTFRLKRSSNADDVSKAAEAAKKLIARGVDGVEVNYIDLPESTAALNLAQATAALHTSLKDVQNAVIRLGPLLMVKRTDADGKVHMAVETISTGLRRVLEKNPSLLQSPDNVLELLQKRRDDENLDMLESTG